VSLALFKTKVSGLRVNLSKSSILLVGQVDIVQILAGVLCCKITSFSITYLGLPLGAKFKEKALWDQSLGDLRKDCQVGRRLIFLKGED